MAIQDQQFLNYHLYRKAVRRKQVHPLTHSCGTELMGGWGKDDEFVLKCHVCPAIVVPGLAQLDLIKRVAEGFYE